MFGKVRTEYIEVKPNVQLHVTDAGDGKPSCSYPEGLSNGGE